MIYVFAAIAGIAVFGLFLDRLFYLTGIRDDHGLMQEVVELKIASGRRI